MPNNYLIDAKAIEGRTFQPVLLEGGLDQETSKFSVYPGTLQDVLNYEGTTRGYTRSQGLLFYDGTYDSYVENMWFIGALDTEATLTGSGFTLAGEVTWGTESTGRVVYYKRTSGSPDYTMLGVIEVIGSAPADGDTLTDTTTSTTLVLGGSMAYPPVKLPDARNPSTSGYIADTITKYLAFMNNTVNAELVGQTGTITTTTPNSYHGTVPGVGPITGGWQFGDSTYIVRDFYSVGFTNGSELIVPGDEIIISVSGGVGNQRIGVSKVVLTSGEWTSGTAAGYIILKPTDNTANLRGLSSIATLDAIRNLASSQIALVSTATAVYGGIPWKATTFGWQFQDTGWEIEYNTGTNAPNVQASPLFLPDIIAATRSTGFLAVATPTIIGSAPFITWTNEGNITADDAAYATCAMNSGESSRYLIGHIPTTAIPHDDVRIVGVEVVIQAKYVGANAPIDTDVSLINTTTGGTFYLSNNKASRTALTGADADVTYGSATDIWGIGEIDAADMIAGNVGVRVQFSNNSGGGGTAGIDYISINVHYVPNSEKVWFYDGSSDVATGIIHAFQIESGDFGATNDAAGQMAFMDISDASAIGVGMAMYSESSAGGVLIANVSSAPSYNILPSAAEMLEEGSQYGSILANYYENDETEAVYGVTGAGSAFTFDGDSFAFLRVPIVRAIDKPRHLSFHDNRLALGYASGHVVLSAVGVPNNFSGVDSSSSWGVGDRVTGLLSLPGNVLGVFSETSIRTLEGSDAAAGTMRTVTSTGGCREYTLQNIANPYFADNRGISGLNTTADYGDFDMAKLSDPIRSWVQDRLQQKRSVETVDTRPVASVSVRNKNQYRLYFADGYILNLYFTAKGNISPTLQHYDTAAFSTDYVPKFINSTVLSTGRERIVIGCESGDVFIVDESNLIQHPDGILTPYAYIVTNPMNFGSTSGLHKMYHVLIQGQFYGAQTVSTWAGTNYIFDETGAAQDTITFGSYANQVIFNSQNELDSTYLGVLTDGFSLKLQTTLDGSKPHSFQSLLFRASKKGTDRNSADKSY